VEQILAAECTSSAYDWCDSWQCVAAWLHGQGANNAFTLMGAIGTVWAVLWAIRLANRQTKERLTEDRVRARVAAAEALPALARVRGMCIWVANLVKDSMSQGDQNWYQVLRDLHQLPTPDQLPRISQATLLLMAPIPGNVAADISAGYVLLDRLFGVLEMHTVYKNQSIEEEDYRVLDVQFGDDKVSRIREHRDTLYELTARFTNVVRKIELELGVPETREVADPI
jgi:hypothetical protein